MTVDAWVLWLAAALVGYLLGAVPTAYLVVKKLKGVDIRTVGSGNSGATNVKRVAGGKPALFVLLVDFMKSFIPVTAAKALFPDMPMMHVILALAAVLGHSKSVFLGFAGGKSAATGLGGIVGLAPLPGLIMAMLAVTIIKVTRIVSVGTLITAVSGPVLLYLFDAPVAYIAYAVLAAGYVVYLHKANIARLMAGTENRI